MRRIPTLFGLLLLMGACTGQQGDLSGSQASLPDTVSISEPADSVVEAKAAYVGIWEGSWENGTLDAKYAIESVTSESAEVVYAWGVSRRWNITEPGWVRAEGTFVEGNRIRAQHPSGTYSILKLADDGETLNAEYNSGGGNTASGRFIRVEGRQ